MRKNIAIISLTFLFNFSFSQTKIYILHENKKENENPYSLVTISDSTYVKFLHSEDMGLKYGFYYEFANSIKDGHYQIFVNNILKRELFFKNHMIDKADVTFFSNGKVKTIDYYVGGKKNGNSKIFYENGLLNSFGEYEDDFSFIVTRYYQNNKVESRTFFLPDYSNSRTEYYDENGRIRATYDGNIQNSPILEIENKFSDGILDGQQRYVYRNYFYTIEYQMNEIVKFTLRKDGVIIKEKNFR